MVIIFYISKVQIIHIMVNFKSYIRSLLIGLVVLSCATQKPLTDRPPAFGREACLKDKIKEYLNSGESFVDSVWYYKGLYPLSYPAYDRYVDSLIDEGISQNIPVIGIRYDAPCPDIDLRTLKIGTPALHDYCKKCDSAENINAILTECLEEYSLFLNDSLGIDPNYDPYLVDSESDKIKWDFIISKSKENNEAFKKLVQQLGDLKKLK